MNHVELHNDLSDVFKRLKSGQLKPQLAKEIFNGAGKMIANCKNALIANSMGIPCDVPLLGIKAGELAPKPNSILAESKKQRSKLPIE